MSRVRRHLIFGSHYDNISYYLDQLRIIHIARTAADDDTIEQDLRAYCYREITRIRHGFGICAIDNELTQAVIARTARLAMPEKFVVDVANIITSYISSDNM